MSGVSGRYCRFFAARFAGLDAFAFASAALRGGDEILPTSAEMQCRFAAVKRDVNQYVQRISVITINRLLIACAYPRAYRRGQRPATFCGDAFPCESSGKREAR